MLEVCSAHPSCGMGVRVWWLSEGVDLRLFQSSSRANASIFNEIISTLIKNDLKIDRNLIITCLEKKGLSGSTPARRFSTIKAWINWIKNEL